MAQTTPSRQSTTFPQGSPFIRVEHLTRTIATRTQRTIILDDVTFTIPAQSLFAVNGPSGSGKSTLLNMLTGIDRPTRASYLCRTGVARPGRERAGALARPACGDHLPVLPIGAYAHRARKRLAGAGLGRRWHLPRSAWRKRAQDCLEIVGMGAFGNRLPSDSPAGSNSASPSPAPWPTIHRCSSPTSRPATSTRTRRTRSLICSQA